MVEAARSVEMRKSNVRNWEKFTETFAKFR